MVPQIGYRLSIWVKFVSSRVQFWFRFWVSIWWILIWDDLYRFFFGFVCFFFFFSDTFKKIIKEKNEEHIKDFSIAVPLEFSISWQIWKRKCFASTNLFSVLVVSWLCVCVSDVFQCVCVYWCTWTRKYMSCFTNT